MANVPKDMLAEASEIRKAVKSLRRKSAIDSLIRRGIAPDRIERTIRDAEAAADTIADKARARIAHRKRAKLRIVKS
jgi:sugar-specific transcriptional regulator TrmB